MNEALFVFLAILLTGIIILVIHKIRRPAERPAAHQDSPASSNIPPLQPDALPRPEGMPADTVIGPDGLPRLKNAAYGWGRRYNAFVTASGTHYHRSKCKAISGKDKRVIHLYTAIGSYTPCNRCHPKQKIDEWYLRYVGKEGDAR